MLTIHNITKHYFNVTALDAVSMTVPAGETLGIVGPNGAGKSTLFRIVAGLITADAGELRPDQPGWPTVSYKPDRLIFPNRLRVEAYLALVCRLAGLKSAEAQRVIAENLDRVGLAEKRQAKIGALSKGMRQRLGLAQALIGRPALLLLDEPSNGLDPQGQAEMAALIRDLHAEGRTVILSSHQLQEVTTTCSHLAILDRGRIRWRGTMAEALRMHPTVTITCDRPPTGLHDALLRLHPEIELVDNVVTLPSDSRVLRHQALTLLLSAGYDVVHLEQSRNTLADVYTEVLQS